MSKYESDRPVSRQIGTTFDVTEEHLALLRGMYVGWQDDEFGAPEIDPKRPYGNSDVLDDIGEALGLEVPDPDKDEEWNEEAEARLTDLHRETEIVLQIVLVTGRFEVGHYQRPDRYGIEWVKTDV